MRLLLLILFSSLFLKASTIDSLVQEYHLSQEELNALFQNNDSIKDLSEFKDDSLSITIKLAHLQTINKNRTKRKLNKLSLNLLASRMANQITFEAAKQNYLSHWNLKGEKPYHRWGKLGQASHIEENTFSYQESKTLKNDYRQALKMMAVGHHSFISEKAPNDGHKQAILRKEHTSVGLGFTFYKNQFRYNEEFIDAHFKTIEYQNKGNEVKVQFKTNKEQYVHFAVISSEKISSKSVKWLNRSGSYLDQGKDIVDRIPFFHMKETNDYYEFSSTKLESGKVYYIQIYIGDKSPNKNRLSSKNLFPASGIVIFK